MKIIPSLILTAALCGVTGVHADELPATQVHYADLNLGHEAGVKALYARLGRAATQVCAPYAVPGKDLARSVAYKTCIGEAVARAVMEVNHPELIRYANQIGDANRERSRLARK
jgi:UrcA family protein